MLSSLLHVPFALFGLHFFFIPSAKSQSEGVILGAFTTELFLPSLQMVKNKVPFHFWPVHFMVLSCLILT